MALCLVWKSFAFVKSSAIDLFVVYLRLNYIASEQRAYGRGNCSPCVWWISCQSSHWHRMQKKEHSASSACYVSNFIGRHALTPSITSFNSTDVQSSFVVAAAAAVDASADGLRAFHLIELYVICQAWCNMINSFLLFLASSELKCGYSSSNNNIASATAAATTTNGNRTSKTSLSSLMIKTWL